MNVLKALSTAVLLTAAAAAQADIVTYTTQSAFNAATFNRGVDTYNDLSLALMPEQVSRTAGSFSYLASAPTSNLYGAGTATDGWLSTNKAADLIVLSGFMPSATAIGGNFFGSDIAGQWVEGSTVTLHVTDGTDSVDYTLNNSQVNSFVGFSSTRGMVSLTVQSVSSKPLWPTVNNFTVGQVLTPVPEPAQYAMLLGGLAALGLAAKRGRRA